MPNQGERDELIVQLKLIELRQTQTYINDIGTIKNVGFLQEYSKLPDGYDLQLLQGLPYLELKSEALKYGISKAKGNYKADSRINDIPFSIKSNNHAPPAIVNHTARHGFEFVAHHCSGNLIELDKIIEQYWILRLKKTIAEDVNNTNANSPFRLNKNILKPFINYFLFEGTGSSLSDMPVSRILGFTDPLDVNTWKVYDKENAIDLHWDKLIFSLRAKKGMPSGYPDRLSPLMETRRESIEKWTKFSDGNYRGALHIRTR